MLFSRQELVCRPFHTSMHTGDVRVMELILKMWCVQLLAGQQLKYCQEVLNICGSMQAGWSEELGSVIRSNSVMNSWWKRKQ